MAGVFLTTTRRGLMRPLASQGIFATDCYHQVRALLEQRLGPAHAALLAEPVHGAGGSDQDPVDWYAESSSGEPPVRLDTLPPDEQVAARQRIISLAADIRALSKRMTEGGDAHHALSGEMLALVLQHPGGEDLWMVEGQPVVVNWGFASGAVGAQPEDLTRLGEWVPPVSVASLPPSSGAAGSVPARSGCLPWLFPLVLALLLLAALLYGGGALPLPVACVRLPDHARLDDARDRERDLTAQRDTLRDELTRRAALCRPGPPEKVLPPPLTPEAEPDGVEPPLTEPFLAMTPEEEPRPVPAPEGKAAPFKSAPKPATKSRKDDPLRIPDKAAEKDDLTFLEGCWRSETGLVNMSGEAIVAEYCFDKQGRGTRAVYENSGGVCKGGVTARFDGLGRLIMDSQEAVCDGRRGAYVPQSVECAGNDTSTHCQGRERLGKSRGRDKTWDAEFYRK